MSCDTPLTLAESKAAELLSTVAALRKPVTEHQSRLHELRARRSEMDSFSTVDAFELAAGMLEHEKQIHLHGMAVDIARNRLHAELGKAAGVLSELQEQTEEHHLDPDRKYIDDEYTLYESRYQSEVQSLKTELLVAQRDED